MPPITTRRSWKDLTPQGLQNGSRPIRPGSFAQPNGLEDAAALLPDSPITDLLKQRQTLEAHMAGLTQGANSSDPREAIRFPVASFAQRQQQEQEWEQQRTAAYIRARQRIRGSVGGGRTSMVPMTPFEERSQAGLPERSGLGANRDTNGLSSLKALGQSLNSQAQNMSRQMKDLDRQLAEKDVSQADRDEIQKTMHGKEVASIGGALSKANKTLDAPKKLVGKLLGDKLDYLTAPMDSAGPYAQERERRLSSETGGSGDLFDRMKANRKRALERRREQHLQELRDEGRRKKAQKNYMAKSKEQKREEA